MLPMKYLVSTARKVADTYKIDYPDAASVVAHYSNTGDNSGVDRCAALDADAIKKAAAVVGVVLPDASTDHGEKIDNKSTEKSTAQAGENNAVSDADITQEKAENRHKKQKADKQTTKKENKPIKENKDNMEKPPRAVERFTGGVVSSDAFGALPADFSETVADLIFQFCDKYNIEDMKKASALQWGGACQYCGAMIKKTEILKKHAGGRDYDMQKINELLLIWCNACGAFDKVPLAADFIALCGFSMSAFYNNGASVNPGFADLQKRLIELQEKGLSSVLVDGRRNPTGTIFFLKNNHGWKDQREVIHSIDNSGGGFDALPEFGQPGQ